jgi:antitoxin (DNA-binding transcriptional repressor) of toxin-antitoxin stability system
MKHRVVNVTEFKAKCLALLDEIGKSGGSITVTRRGRPLATVGPAQEPAWKSPEGSWVGKILNVDELLEVDTADLWEVSKRRRRSRR